MVKHKDKTIHKTKHHKLSLDSSEGKHDTDLDTHATTELLGEHELEIGSVHNVKSLISKHSKDPFTTTVPPNTGLEELGEIPSVICSTSSSSVSSYDDDELGLEIDFDPKTTRAVYYVTSSGDFVNQVIVGNEGKNLEKEPSIRSIEFVDMDPALMGKRDETSLSDDEELQHLKNDFEYDLITYIDEEARVPECILQTEVRHYNGEDRGEALPESIVSEAIKLKRKMKKKKYQHLDWSNHNLHELPLHQDLKNIKSIDISQNFLRDVKALGLLPTLLKIDASKNEMTQFLDIETDDLFPILQVDFSRNKITTLLNLYRFWGLEVVDLSYNGLTCLDRFQQCYYLRVLNVAHNMISEIRNLRCPNLIILNLKDNCLEDLSGLRDCPKLVYLNISRNKIKDLSIIQELPELIELRCSSNEIEMMELENIKVLMNLSQLKISPNLCMNVPFSRLVLIYTLPQLRVLDGLQIMPEEMLEARNIFNPTPEKLAFEDHTNAMIDKVSQSAWTIYDEFVRLHPIPPMLFLVGTPKSNANELATKLRDKFKYHIMLGGVHSTATTIDIGNPNVDIPVSMDGFIELKKRGDLYSTASILGRVCGFSGTQITRAAERGILLCGTIPLETALALRKWRFMPKLVLILPSSKPHFNVDDYLSKEKERKESIGSTTSLNESKSSTSRPRSRDAYAIKFSNKTSTSSDPNSRKLTVGSTGSTSGEAKRSILKRSEASDLDSLIASSSEKSLSQKSILHQETTENPKEDQSVVPPEEMNPKVSITRHESYTDKDDSSVVLSTSRSGLKFDKSAFNKSTTSLQRKPTGFFPQLAKWVDDDDDPDFVNHELKRSVSYPNIHQREITDGDLDESPSGLIHSSESSIIDCGENEAYIEEVGEDGFFDLVDENSDDDAKSEAGSENKFKHRDALNAAILNQRDEYLQFHQDNPGFFTTVLDTVDLDESFNELEQMAKKLIDEFESLKIDKYPLVQNHAGRNNKNQHFFVEDRLKHFTAQNREWARGYAHPLQHRQTYQDSAETNPSFKQELPPPNSLLTPEFPTKWSDAKIRQLKQATYYRIQKETTDQQELSFKLQDAKEKKKEMQKTVTEKQSENKLSQIYNQPYDDKPKIRLPNLGYVQQLQAIQSIVRK